VEKIKKFFANNWKAKLGSFLFAIILWFLITATQSSITTFPGTIPISFNNISSDLVAIPDQDSVQIKISAENVNLGSIKESNFRASIDLSGLNEGTYKKDVIVNSSDSNIKITTINPNVITVRIEKKVSKKVPARVRFDGSASDGFGVADTSIDPAEVEISGAESIIQTITEVVAPIKLTGENADFAKKAELFAYTASGQEIKNVIINPDSATAKVKIAKTGETKTIGIKVNVSGNLAPGYWVSSISTDPQVITISGPQAQIASIKYIETEQVDISNLKGNETFSVGLIIPPGFVTQGNVTSVKVKMDVSQSDNAKEVTLVPNFLNLEKNLQVSSFNPSKILAIFTGPKDTIGQINSDNITLDIDLSSTIAGNFDLPLQSSFLKFPANITFLNFEPDKIAVTIEPK